MVSVSATNLSISLIFGADLLALWLLFSGYDIKELSSRAIASLSGHLRARPDPWLERTLRDAFARFDRELAAILRDRDVPPPPGLLGQEDPPGPNSR